MDCGSCPSCFEVIMNTCEKCGATEDVAMCVVCEGYFCPTHIAKVFPVILCEEDQNYDPLKDPLAIDEDA